MSSRGAWLASRSQSGAAQGFAGVLTPVIRPARKLHLHGPESFFDGLSIIEPGSGDAAPRQKVDVAGALAIARIPGMGEAGDEKIAAAMDDTQRRFGIVGAPAAAESDDERAGAHAVNPECSLPRKIFSQKGRRKRNIGLCRAGREIDVEIGLPLTGSCVIAARLILPSRSMSSVTSWRVSAARAPPVSWIDGPVATMAMQGKIARLKADIIGSRPVLQAIHYHGAGGMIS
jgi:hypothetical protein